jgi:hypothetical protein
MPAPHDTNPFSIRSLSDQGETLQSPHGSTPPASEGETGRTLRAFSRYPETPGELLTHSLREDVAISEPF